MLDDVTVTFGLRFALAAFLVALALAAFFGAVVFLRRKGTGSLFGAGNFLTPMRGRRNRLQVLESVPVDARRRLVLVRRDHVEHLVLIGGPQDVVIENGIEAPYEAAAPAEQDSRHDYDNHFDDDHANEPQPEMRELEQKRPAIGATIGGALGRGLSLRRSRKAEPAPPTAKAPAPPVYREWDDEDYDDDTIGDDLDLGLPAGDEDDEIEHLTDEPPFGTIRPVTLSRAERAATPAPPAPPEAPRRPDISDEEAALVRELEAARRRIQVPGQGPAAVPSPASAPPRPPAAAPARPTAVQATASNAQVPIGQSDFDRILEREMEARLEAAKRPQPAAEPRPVVQQVRRDPTLPRITGAAPEGSMESGIARIFGEGQSGRDK